MKLITDILLKVGGFILILLGFFNWGKNKSEKEAAEKKLKDVTKEKSKNEKISNKPFVDNPFSKLKLRNKKD